MHRALQDVQAPKIGRSAGNQALAVARVLRTHMMCDKCIFVDTIVVLGGRELERR